MLFHSYIFILLFLPIVVTGYYGINRTGKYKLGLLWLIGMSCWFYGAFSLKYLLLFLGSVVINQAGVQWMKKIPSSPRKKGLFIGMLLLNIGLLVCYKYTNFFIENINQICGADIPLLKIGLPVGISFYTFRQVAYIADCYKEEAEDYSFLEYAAYALFFPLMLQGPIAHHDKVIRQFREEEHKKVNYVCLSKGVYAFARGMAKKVLLADTLSPIVELVFSDLYAYDSGNILIALLCYMLQLYFDFSGYCDMAYGVAKMLGIEIPFNFNSPYKAKSISDFWDRWHITLTKFFTKYVYIPLGGSRKGNFRTYLNILIVFLVSGLWHGASWNFVLWGVLNGTLAILERIFKTAIEKVPEAVRRCVTFVILAFSMSIFRMPSIGQEKALLKQIGEGRFGAVNAETLEYFNGLTEVRLLGRLGLQGIIDAYPAALFLLFMALMLIAVWFFKNTEEQLKTFTFDDTKRYGWKMAGAVICLTWSILSLSEISEFVYWNF